MRKMMIAAAALAGAAMPQVASADVTVTSVTNNPGGKTGDLHYTSATSYGPQGLVLGGVEATRYRVTGLDDGSPIELYAYCLDIFARVGVGEFTQVGLGVLVPNTQRQMQLLALLTNATPLLDAETNANQRLVISAATQIALWEIAYEGGPTPYTGAFDVAPPSSYNSKTGQFYMNGGNGGSARTLANTYLNNVSAGVWTPQGDYSIGVLYSRQFQDLIYLIPGGGVPEAGTWAMLILGMGAVGFAMRRRRSVRVRFA